MLNSEHMKTHGTQLETTGTTKNTHGLKISVIHNRHNTKQAICIRFKKHTSLLLMVKRYVYIGWKVVCTQVLKTLANKAHIALHISVVISPRP